MRIYQCEDTQEGVFTAIYTAYEEKQDPKDTVISTTEELFLFADYKTVTTDPLKAEKVIRTLKRRFGEQDYYRICLALSSADPEKAKNVYGAVAWGLANNPAPGHLLDHLTDHDVLRTFQLARGAEREGQHLKGFLRFEELEGGLLYSRIRPSNHLLWYLMPHFADRFPMENFMVYDEGREVFGVHPAGKEWFLVHCDETESNLQNAGYSADEEMYQGLFRYFCHKIGIEERRNLALQRNMLPLHFREYMVEFK